MMVYQHRYNEAETRLARLPIQKAEPWSRSWLSGVLTVVMIVGVVALLGGVA